MSRPPSPIKKIQRLLSPNKAKPLPPSPQGPLQHNSDQNENWTYADSTTSSESQYSRSTDDDTSRFTGWSVVDTPPSTHHNKENVNITNAKSFVDQVMGRPNTKPSKPSKSEETELDKQFEELMNSRSIPVELRCKLRCVDNSVKQHMLKNHSSLSGPQTKSSSKLFRMTSNLDLSSPKKKGKKYNTVSMPSSPIKTATFTEGKVWDLEMQSVDDVKKYFGSVRVEEIDVGMVKKLWQLLRNESLTWIEEFLLTGGFNVIITTLTDVLAIEWRNEKDDVVLHQILLCLKALSTTENGLKYLAKYSSTLFALLINNLFSDKQPTEFSTRLLIPTLLISHLLSNPTPTVAKTLLSYLSDPAPKDPPHDFLKESYVARPYKKWLTEIHSITRDAFWIFLHPKNVIPISQVKDLPFPLSAKVTAPVPSGFKGGVEWYATEYLTAHISLINAILAPLSPTERRRVRTDMRNCGFEVLMGGKLRKASREYYPGLHLELQRWCWMGHGDGWSVFTVARGEEYEEMPKSELADVQFEVGEFELAKGFEE